MQAVPRGSVTKLSRIPNWSPTVDFVTTTESSRWDNLDGATGKPSKENRQDGNYSTALARTDKIYAAAGTGSNGSIVEYRHGLQASIGIEFDFGVTIRRCFVLSEDELSPGSGYYLLLSVADRSTLLYFDAEFSTASLREIDHDQTAYDLSSPTLIAQPISPGVILQVTETGLVLITPSRPCHISFASLGLGSAVVTDASLEDDILAVTAHTDNAFQLHFIKLNPTDQEAQYMYSEAISYGEVTALSLYTMAGKIHAVACSNLGNAVLIERFCITNQTRDETIPLTNSTLYFNIPLLLQSY